ncbi:glycerol-3-phosphate transporter ATP-binding subunit [compost metagenome]
MNFMRFTSGLRKGASSISLNGVDVLVPEIHQDAEEAELALGVRPEHIRFSDASPLRGAVYGSEYLGTNQIVAIETGSGLIKARVPANRNFRIGETVGLEFNHANLALFDCKSGRAVASSLYSGAQHG